jgi:hypothetical protein
LHGFVYRNKAGSFLGSVAECTQ